MGLFKDEKNKTTTEEKALEKTEKILEGAWKVGSGIAKGAGKFGKKRFDDAKELLGKAAEWAGEKLSSVWGALQGLWADDTASDEIGQTGQYDEEDASIMRTRQIDQILQQERERRKRYIDQADEGIQEVRKKVLAQIKQGIGQSNSEGLQMNDSIVEKQFELLMKGETLAELVNRRYSLGDAECLEILKMEEGADKKRRMQEFGTKLLLEGSEAYFDKLSSACDTAFSYIDDAVSRHTKNRNAEIERYAADIKNFSEEKEEQEQQKAEKQGNLQRLEKLDRLFG